MTKSEVLQAIEDIKKYCSEQESCEDCVMAEESRKDFCEKNFKHYPYEWDRIK